MTRLNEFRKMKDDFFAHDGQSPLTPFENRLRESIRAGKKIYHDRR